MRIFITGGSGLLGSKIAEIALREHEVYAGYAITNQNLASQ